MISKRVNSYRNALRRVQHRIPRGDAGMPVSAVLLMLLNCRPRGGRLTL